MTGSMLEFCVAHEVSHQWWHGMVGSDSREHPFVDESLAQYSAILYLEDRYGAERARRDGDTNVRTSYQMMRVLGTPDAPVDRPVAAYASSLAYAGLVYGKGPYFYEALRKLLGDERFFAALREYTAKNRFREASGRGLADVVATGPKGPEVRALASRWLDEAHGDEDLGELDMGSMMRDMLGGAGGAGGDESQMLQDLLHDLGKSAE
jgi:Peptidase family M1 domain